MGYLRELVICIDPAHYEGYNEGILSSYSEGTIMYQFAECLKEQLEKYSNVSAMLTKYKAAVDLPIEERVNNAKITGANCIISLHTTYEENQNVNEIAVYKSSRGSNELRLDLINTIKKFLDNYIEYSVDDNSSLSSWLLINDRDFFDFMYECESAESMESFILVLGNHNNPSQCNWLCNSVMLKELSYRIAKAITDYYNKNFMDENYKLIHKQNDLNVIKAEDDNMSFKDFKAKIFAERPEVEEYYNAMAPEYALIADKLEAEKKLAKNKDKNTK